MDPLTITGIILMVSLVAAPFIGLFNTKPEPTKTECQTTGSQDSCPDIKDIGTK